MFWLGIAIGIVAATLVGAIAAFITNRAKNQRNLILLTLFRSKVPLYAVQIAKECRLPRWTVQEYLKNLVKENLIECQQVTYPGRRYPIEYYRITMHGRHLLYIYIFVLSPRIISGT